MTLTRAATARRLPTRRVRRAVAGALVVALTTSLGLVGAQAHAPVDGSSGAGDPYWPLDGNGGIDVQSYRIDNTWSFRKQKLRGSTTLELRATQDLSSFSLDFLLPVSSVSVDGVPAAFSTSQKHELRIRPTTPLATDSVHRVRVDYAGVPRKYAYAGERAMIWGPKEVVAMGEPHMSPWWFPANDHPSDKALMDISVTVPAGREAIANGHLVSTRKTKKSTTWRWRADEPMTTYLAFFAAGDFAIRKGTSEGLPWLVAVSRQLPKPSRKASMKLMLRTPAIVRWLEGSLGDYPFSVTGGLTTSLFTGFALENQTRPTYPAVGSQATSLVVHELAHQWFGDDVAVAQWRDIWLNEGFASFMEWYWAESRGEQSGAVQLQRSLRDNPATSDFWKVTIGDPGAERIFDGAVYERGAMTLQALRTRIGNDEVFFRLLRTWSERKSGGNATSAEFEALAAEVTGLDLTAFFTAWLRTGSRPAATADNGLA